MRKLILYTTEGCHLCEKADAILASLGGLKIDKIDIAGFDDLMERYAVRIPVVRCEDARQELSWPFTQAEFAEWYRSL